MGSGKFVCGAFPHKVWRLVRAATSRQGRLNLVGVGLEFAAAEYFGVGGWHR